MKLIKRVSGPTCISLISLITVLMLMLGSAFASDLLSIQPIKYDCGVVGEGVPATMQSIVENTSTQTVVIGSVKTN